MALLATSDFLDLPADPTDRWLQLREKLEQRLEESEDYEQGFSEFTMLEYVSILHSSAVQLNIGPLDTVAPSRIHDEFMIFRANAAGLAASLSVATRVSLQSKTHVVLSDLSKQKILQKLEELRTLTEGADLSESKKNRLLETLDRFETYLDEKALPLAQTMAILAKTATLVVGTTAFLAAAPEAIATISAIIGHQTEANEEKAKLLAIPQEPAVPQLPPPVKALPAPKPVVTEI